MYLHSIAGRPKPATECLYESRDSRLTGPSWVLLYNIFYIGEFLDICEKTVEWV